MFSEFWIGFITGILIYSFIVTITTIYMDNSGYYTIDDLNIVVAGPLLWFVMLFCNVFKKPLEFLYKKYKDKKSNTPRKNKSSKYIEKVVSKIIKNTKIKSWLKDEYVSFEHINSHYEGDFLGYKDLCIKKAKNERLNKKFNTLMLYQKEETIKELEKYFIRVTEDIMQEDNYDIFYINKYKNKTLYKLIF